MTVLQNILVIPFFSLCQETSTTTSNQTVAENEATDAVDETQASENTANDVPQAANGDADVEMPTESLSDVVADVAAVVPEQEALVQSAQSY